MGNTSVGFLTLGLILLTGSSELVSGSISCDFLSDFCGWNPTVVSSSWQITQSMVNNVAPPLGTTAFAYVTSGQESWATFESETISMLPEDTTLSFHIIQQRIEISSPTDLAELQVVKVNNILTSETDDTSDETRETAVTLWSIENANQWKSFTVVIPKQEDPFKLRFRFKVGLNRQVAGLAKINFEKEDVTVNTNMETPTTKQTVFLTDAFLSCTFERSTCAWSNANSNQTNWGVTSEINLGRGTPGAPEASQGQKYLFVKGASSETGPAETRLQSPMFIYTKESSLDFWYNLDAAEEDSQFRVLVHTEGNGSEIVYEAPVRMSGWLPVEIKIDAPTGPVQVIFSTTLSSIQSAAIDEIQWSGDDDGRPVTIAPTVGTTQPPAPTTPQPTTVPPTARPDSTLDCSFTTGICGWRTFWQGFNGEQYHYWERRNSVGLNPVDLTAQPGFDGWFLWAEDRSGAGPRQALLLSPSMKLKSAASVRFWVYTTAPSGPGIFVNLVLESGETIPADYEESHSRTWKLMEFTIPADTPTFSIAIGAEVSRFRRFAIDNVEFDTEEEPQYGSEPFVPSLPVTTPPTLPPTTTGQPLPQPVTDMLVSCSFSTGQCGWRTDNSSEGSWATTQNAGVPNLPLNSSPLIQDVTFIAFRGSGDGVDRGLLRSPRFSNTAPRNISFWYVKRGTGTSVSNLALRIEKEPGVETPNLWRVSGDSGSEWEHASVNIAETGNISLIFYCGASHIIVCGLDEIELDSEADVDVEPPADYVPESMSITCDFEQPYPFCGWKNEPESETWTVGTNRSVAASQYGINEASSNDQFLYVNRDVLESGVRAARLVSRPFIFGSVQAKLELKYRLTGPGIDSFNVFLKSGNTLKVLFTTSTPVRRWESLNVKFCAEDGDQLIIEAKWVFPGFVFGIDKLVLVNETDTMNPPTDCVAHTEEPFTTRQPPTTSSMQTTTVQPENQISCGFEDWNRPFCGWARLLGSIVRWRSQIAENGTENTSSVAPMRGAGHAYVRAADATYVNRLARLISPSFQRALKSTLSFYYRISGSGIESLTLYLRREKTSVEFGTNSGWNFTTLFTETSAYNVWLYKQIEICVDQPRDQLILDAALIFGQAGEVNIDEVVLRGEELGDFEWPDSSCPTYDFFDEPTTTEPPATTTVITIPPATIEGNVGCNFTEGTCGWESTNFDVPDTPLYGIDSEGHDQYLVASSNNGTKATIASADITVTSGQINRFQFDYATTGRGVRSLTIYVAVNNVLQMPPVHEIILLGNPRNWTTDIVTFSAPDGVSTYRLVLEANFLLPNFAVAVDNFVLEKEDDATVGNTATTTKVTVPALVPILPAGTCHFESGICEGWSDTGDIPWELVLGSGPEQTKRENAYIYSTQIFGGIEYSSKLQTAMFDAGTVGQVTFWIRGAFDQGEQPELTIYAVTSSTNLKTVVYKSANLTVNEWTYQEANFCLPDGGVLLFEVHHRSLFAVLDLDEILTKKLTSIPEGLLCDPATTAPTETTEEILSLTTVIVPSCMVWRKEETASCDFDTTICPEWTDTENGFLFDAGGTIPQSDIRPLAGSGFAYPLCNVAEADPVFGEESVLQTPFIPLSANESFVRLSFWYWLNFADQSTNFFRVLEVPEGEIEDVVTLFNQDQGQSQSWRRAEIVFRPSRKVALSFVVNHIECVVGSSPFGLDSVVIETGSDAECSAPPSINVTCSFESGDACGWQLATGPNRWKVSSGEVGNGSYSIPGAFGEYYLSLNSDTLPNFGRPSDIKTVTLPPMNTTISFLRRTFGFGINGLDLFGEVNGRRYLLWSGGESGRRWIEGTARICFNESFSLIFEGTFISRGFVIGLDEIRLESEQTGDLGNTDNCEPMEEYTTAALPTTTTPRSTTRRTSPTTTKPTTTTAAPILLPPDAWEGDITCDFENENEKACGWQTLANLSDAEAVDFYWDSHESFVIASLEDNNGSVARLMSANLPADHPSAINLEFYYLSSRGVILSIYAANSTVLPVEPVWSTGAGDGTEWKKAVAVFDFDKSYSRRQLIIEARFLLQRPTDFVAIDDIILQGENGAPFTATESSVTQPPLKRIIEAATCAFDYGFCEGWTTRGPHKWVPSQGYHDGVAPQSGRGFVEVDNHEDWLNKDPTRLMYAELLSGDFANETVNGSTMEVSFWYYVGSGTTEMELYSVLVEFNTTNLDNIVGKALLWSAASSKALSGWRHVTVAFCADSEVYLMFRATAGNGFTAAALDEVQTYLVTDADGACAQHVHTNDSVSCDFEEDTCGWDLVDSPLRWTRGNGSSGSSAYAIENASSGEYYLYVDSDDLPSPATIADIKTPFVPSQDSTISFYYRAHGFGVASLNLFAETRTARYILWNQTSHGREWVHANVTVCMRQPFKFVFEGRFFARGFTIGLDDIVLSEPVESPAPNCTLLEPYTTERPPTNPTEPAPTTPVPTTRTTTTEIPIPLPPTTDGQGTCSFDNGTLCNWRPLNLSTSESQLPWEPVSSVGFGPNAILSGFTGASFISASTVNDTGSVARVMSPNLVDVQATTLRVQFYYRVNGRGVSGISLYLATSDLLPSRPAWTTTPTAYNQWVRAVASVPSTRSNRQSLIIEARFLLRNSWIGIDDIIIAGENDQTVAPDPVTQPPKPPTTYIAAGTCSFDYDLCESWKPVEDTGFQGEFTNGSNLGFPVSAMSRGFLIVSNKIYSPTDKPMAALQTPSLSTTTELTGTATTQFYFAVGLGTAEIRVRGVPASGSNVTETSVLYRRIVTVKSAEEISWIDAVFSVCLEQFDALVFEVLPGKGFTFVALDEIATTKDDRPHGDACLRNASSDEITCGFEDGLCSWRNRRTSETFELIWTVTQGASSTGDFYLSATQLGSDPFIAEAAIYSGQIPLASAELQTFTFNYRVNSESIGYLKFGFVGQRDFEPLWRANKDKFDSKWHQATVIICQSPGDRLEFRTNMVQAALDDFVLVQVESPNDLTCPSRISCTFDEGWCDWESENSTAGFWRTNQPIGPIPKPQPGSGYLLGNSGNESYETAELSTVPSLKLKSSSKFTFWYIGGNISPTAQQNDTQLLLMKGRKGPAGTTYDTLWSDAGFGTERKWKRGSAVLCDEDEFTLLFRATFIAKETVIGLDTFELENEDAVSGQLPTTNLNCPNEVRTSITCDFENADLCGWTNIGEVVLWLHTKGKTGTDDQFNIPHAGSGTYYLSASANHRPFGNSVATIVSRTITTRMPRNTKLDFWYHMKGSGIRYLRLVLRDANGNHRTIWERKGHQGLTWMMAEVPVSAQPGSRLIFEVSFTLPNHQVGLDHVVFHGEDQPDTAYIPESRPVATCDFENDACGWVLNENVKRVPVRDWDAETPGSSGFYILIERTPQNVNESQEETIFQSSLVNTTQEATLSFWARIFTKPELTFQLFIVTDIQSKAAPRLVLEEHFTEAYIGNWTRYEVSIEETGGFKIMFRVSGGYDTFIYLDDIELTNEEDSVTFVTPTTRAPDVTTPVTEPTMAEVSTASLAADTTPVSTRLPTLPTRPPTKAPMSREDIIVTSVGSVAGALVLLAVVLALIHWRSKRRQRDEEYGAGPDAKTTASVASTRPATVAVRDERTERTEPMTRPAPGNLQPESSRQPAVKTSVKTMNPVFQGTFKKIED